MKKYLKSNSGSASVEASIVLPVFLFAMLAFYFIGQIGTVETVIYEAAAETAEYMAEYAYLEENYVSSQVLDAAFAKTRFIKYIDDPELVDRFIYQGVMGVTFIGSDFKSEDGYIYLRFSYALTINVPIIGNLRSVRSREIRQKAYLGYTYSKKETNEEKDPYVFVADNSVVYHTTRSCTYLSPGIIKTNIELAKKNHYQPCSACKPEFENIVIITEYGDRYHSSVFCSNINRNIKRIRLSEAGGMPACSKCGK